MNLTPAPNHEELFATLLQLERAGPGETKQLIEHKVPRSLGTYYDGKLENARELLLSTDVASTNLIQTEFYGTIIEGATVAKCMREAVPRFPMSSNKQTVTFRTSTGYMKQTPEGAPAPINEADYTTRDFEVMNFRERSFITQNMIDDGAYALVAEEVKHHGERAENTLNHYTLGVMIENAGLENDAAETAASEGGKSIVAAKQKVKGAGFKPDTVVMCTDAETFTLNEIAVTNYTGSEAVRKGTLPPMFGLKPHVCDTTTSSSTYTWGYGTNAYVGMIVFDSRAAAKIGMRQDITVTDYKDPVRDLTSAIVKLRFAANYGVAKAMARCVY